MTQQEEYYEEVGYRAVEKYRSNLEGIINEINAIKEYKIDTASIEDKLKVVDEELKALDKRIKELSLTSEAMITESEGFILGPLVKELKDITDEYRRNIKPLYEIYTLLTEINETINKIGDVNRVIELSKLLINSINNINTHNNVDVTTLVDAAYHSIFDALQYEIVFNKNDLFKYINTLNLSSNKEYLGKIIRKSISQNDINENLLKEEKLKHLDEGAEYDYLSQEILFELSKENLAGIYSDIIREKLTKEHETEEKKKVCDNRLKGVNREIESSNEGINSYKTKLLQDKLKLFLARSALIGYAAIPTFGCYGSYSLGKHLSDQVTEYSTVTKEIDLSTNKVIKEEKIYDEKETNYVVTVVVYEPWQIKPGDETRYIRRGTAYEYYPDDINDVYNLNVDYVESNLKPKYMFSEIKEDLLKEEKRVDTKTICITETYQDKEDSRKSTKYTVPVTIFGSALSIAITIALIMVSLRKLLEMISSLKDDVDSDKYKLMKYQNQYNELLAEKTMLEDELNHIELSKSLTRTKKDEQ